MVAAKISRFARKCVVRERGQPCSDAAAASLNIRVICVVVVGACLTQCQIPPAYVYAVVDLSVAHPSRLVYFMIAWDECFVPLKIVLI